VPFCEPTYFGIFRGKGKIIAGVSSQFYHRSFIIAVLPSQFYHRGFIIAILSSHLPPLFYNYLWCRSIAGMHNIRPAGQMWPAEAFNVARETPNFVYYASSE